MTRFEAQEGLTQKLGLKEKRKALGWSNISCLRLDAYS
jgi:hypothetical protein